MPSKRPPNKNLHDAIAEELTGGEEAMGSLLETNPDFDAPEAFQTTSSDFDMGSETRVLKVSSDVQRALDAGVTLNERKLDPLPSDVGAVLEVGDKRVPLTKPLTIIGRVKEVSDIALSEDDQVSRHHAAITYVGGEFFIQDLDSTNGTFLDGKRIRRAVLAPGMIVRVGSTEIRLTTRRR